MLSLLIFMKLGWRKNRLITELALLVLSEYWVEICWIEIESLRFKESAMSNRKSL